MPKALAKPAKPYPDFSAVPACLRPLVQENPRQAPLLRGVA